MSWAEKWNNFKQKAGEVINDGVSFVKDNAHTLLDAAGFIPGVGTVADVINAGIYVAEGDWKNAGLSALSAVPAIGDGIAAVSKSTKVVKAAKTISKIGDIANEGVGLYGDIKDALNGDLSGIGMNLLFAKISKGKIETGATSKKLKENDDFIDEIKSKNKKSRVNGKCFTGDTLVCTKEGYLPIKNIRAGDDIYSREEKTGETGFQKVEEVFLNHAHTIYAIEIDTKTKIKTTAYHPFYVEGEGWVTAIQLQVGAKLQTMEGTATITNLKKERTEEAVPVYNFHVSEWVSYFVSELDVYVHNGGCGSGNSRTNIESGYKAGDVTPGGRIFTDHAAKRANERNFDAQKIDTIINNNTKNRYKYFDEETKQWKIRYRDKRGNTVITDSYTQNIITVFSYPKSINNGNYISKNSK